NINGLLSWLWEYVYQAFDGVLIFIFSYFINFTETDINKGTLSPSVFCCLL
ncbi:hypothetical protein ACJX0J_023036, partial [Zea mays]